MLTKRPQSGSRSPFLIELICTTRRRIPAGASTNRGAEKRGLMPQDGFLVIPNIYDGIGMYFVFDGLPPLSPPPSFLLSHSLSHTLSL